MEYQFKLFCAPIVDGQEQKKLWGVFDTYKLAYDDLPQALQVDDKDLVWPDEEWARIYFYEGQPNSPRFIIEKWAKPQPCPTCGHLVKDQYGIVDRQFSHA